MRIGVIRNDLPGPIYLADLESKSQHNASVDPPGQTRAINRPDAALIAEYLASQGLVANASALITETVPVGGPLNVSAAKIKAVAGLATATNAQVRALQDFLAPHIADTHLAVQSFQVGNIAGFKDANYSCNGDLPQGAAIAVVQDDGVTPFVAPLPNITGVDLDDPSAGWVTVKGTGLGNAEYAATTVKITYVKTNKVFNVPQEMLVAKGGSVTATSIVIPANMVLPNGGTLPAIALGDKISVQHGTRASNTFTVV